MIGFYSTQENTGGVTPGSIVDADVNAAAAVQFSKLEALNQGETLVGSAANVATAYLDYLVQAGGNITGAVAIDPANGNYYTGTLTGAIVPTVANGSYENEIMVLEFTQDGVGSHGVTWQAGFKKAGGTLTIAQGAAEITTVAMRWNAVNWVEMGRNINLS